MAWLLGQHLATVAVLVLLVHVLGRVMRAGPVVRHALWALVLVKLMMPPVVSWPWTLPAPLEPIHAQLKASPASRIDDRGTSTREAPGGSPAASDAFEPLAQSRSSVDGLNAAVESGDRAEPRGDPGPLPITASFRVSRVSSVRWTTIAGVIWLAGTLMTGGVHLVRIRRLVGLVRRSIDAGPDLQRLLADAAHALGVAPVPVRIAPGIDAPFVWALGRPMLLWPADQGGRFGAASARAVLAHELAHIKRRDHWMGWIDLAGSLAWWWLPLYWHIRRELRRSAELACDAWAADTAVDRRVYAEALLAMCATPSRATAPLSAVGIRAGDRRFLERRLAMIMRARVPLHLSRTAWLVVACVAMLSLPAWARQAPAPPSPPLPPAAPAAMPAPPPLPAVVPEPSPAPPAAAIAARPEERGSMVVPAVPPPRAAVRDRTADDSRAPRRPGRRSGSTCSAHASCRDADPATDRVTQRTGDDDQRTTASGGRVAGANLHAAVGSGAP